MKTFDFAGSLSASPVAGMVTFAVSAWFLVAGGLMLTEAPAHSSVAEAAPLTTSVVYSAPAVAIAPEARLIIVVEGRRA